MPLRSPKPQDSSAGTLGRAGIPCGLIRGGIMAVGEEQLLNGHGTECDFFFEPQELGMPLERS